MVLSIGSYKASGSDRLSALVYKIYWDITGNRTILLVQDFFWNGYLDPTLNRTFITLIEKVRNPYQVQQFQSISMCSDLEDRIKNSL